MPRLTNLTVDYVSLVDRAAVRDPANPTEPQRFLLAKSEVPVFTSRGKSPSGGSMTDTEKDLRERAEKAEAKAAKLEAKLAKREKAIKADTGADADLRAKLAKAEKEAQATAERAEKAERIAKQERVQRVQREFIAKAQDEFPHLGNPAELGPELMRMSEKLSKDDFESHLKRLAAANEQIRKGALFSELGHAGESADGSAHTQKLAKAVADIRKADSSLSEYQAREKALAANPDLAAELAAANR
ncbi:MAG: hypothetical protein ACYCQK_01675 [Acidiferrobacteraceae bacterium]